MNASSLSRLLGRAGHSALLLATASCAQPAATTAVAIPTIPAGEARISFYRDYEPYAGKGLPAVAANGAYVGSAQLGGAFYRNVPPGHYHVTVETVGIDFNQSANFDIAPGQQAYVKIVSNPEWVSDGDRHTYERPTFYAWLISNQVAQADVVHLTLYGGS